MSQKTVFISYSHDSEMHKNRVLALSQRLREDGINTLLDQYHAEGWERWMMDCIEQADHVLCVCTATYYRRFRGHETPGKGLGGNWEGALITSEIYQNGSYGNKFTPVLFEASDKAHIVEPLLSRSYYLINNEDNYAALYDALLGQAGVEPAPVGDLKCKPRRQAQSLSFGEKPDAPPPVDIQRILKYAPARLIGREAELEQLDAAWNQAVAGVTPRPRVYTLVALGGEGKTSLAAKWATGLADRGWPGAEAAFAWSFYSQGSKDQSAASGEVFLGAALRFFGDAALADSAQGAHEKGQRLAQLVGEKRNLLILDGLEPLQFPPTSPTPGLLKDQGVAALLQGLAGQSAGLCVVTTRYAIDDLKAYQGNGAPQIDLLSLSVEAGTDLLRERGVTGSADEFTELVQEVKGHALTLTLLGAYLKDAHGGDIRKRDLIRLRDADAEEQGGHAFRVMDAYARWLETDGEKGRRAVEILRLMGLFDRPADAGCLGALFKAPAITGLTETLVTKNEAQRNLALARLESAKLLTVSRNGAGMLVALDTHPLLREYFAQQLRTENPGAWRAAHRRLYKHLCATTKEGEHPSLEELQPLYQAVAHGCWAGMYEEACAKIYRDRILRGEEAYSIHKLGAFAPDLGAVACFFEPPWRRLTPVLNDDAQAWLLNEAAYRLRALGRLNEALEPMRVGMKMRVKCEDWENAARSASNLSELEVTLGALNEALADGSLAVTYAECSGEELERMARRTTHADALQQAGCPTEAAALFREAEAIQAKRQPAYPLLYSWWGFRYGEYLFAPAERAAWHTMLPSHGTLKGGPRQEPAAAQRLGRRRWAGSEGDSRADQPTTEDLLATCSAVTQRATQTLLWANQNKAGPLTIALEHLTLGRAAFYTALLSGTSLGTDCRAHLETAVTGLRRAGDTTQLPRSLLTRAWLRACDGHHVGPDSAKTDLDEAWEIAARGPMPLFLADIHLHRARLFGALSNYPWESPADDLKEARRLIEKHGYGRRREELEDAEAWLAARDANPTV